MKNKCIFCDIEDKMVVLTEFQDGWAYACQDIIECQNRISKNLVAKNIQEYHKGEVCKNVPEIKCSEGLCISCQLDKESV